MVVDRKNNAFMLFAYGYKGKDFKKKLVPVRGKLVTKPNIRHYWSC